jgi:hypothetical protein
VSSNFIGWCIERVDLAIKKHSMHIEPEIRFKNFLAGRPRSYKETDPVKLQGQVNDLSDLLVLVIRERDKLSEANKDLKERLRFLNLKFWILSSVVVAEGGMIAWLATALFSKL